MHNQLTKSESLITKVVDFKISNQFAFNLICLTISFLVFYVYRRAHVYEFGYAESMYVLNSGGIFVAPPMGRFPYIVPVHQLHELVHSNWGFSIKFVGKLMQLFSILCSSFIVVILQSIVFLLSRNHLLAIMTVLFLLLTPGVAFFGSVIGPDSLMLLLVFSGYLCFILGLSRTGLDAQIFSLLGGACAGIAIWTRVVAVFYLPAYAVFVCLFYLKCRRIPLSQTFGFLCAFLSANALCFWWTLNFFSTREEFWSVMFRSDAAPDAVLSFFEKTIHEVTMHFGGIYGYFLLALITVALVRSKSILKELSSLIVIFLAFFSQFILTVHSRGGPLSVGNSRYHIGTYIFLAIFASYIFVSIQSVASRRLRLFASIMLISLISVSFVIDRPRYMNPFHATHRQPILIEQNLKNIKKNSFFLSGYEQPAFELALSEYCESCASIELTGRREDLVPLIQSMFRNHPSDFTFARFVVNKNGFFTGDSSDFVQELLASPDAKQIDENLFEFNIEKFISQPF